MGIRIKIKIRIMGRCNTRLILVGEELAQKGIFLDEGGHAGSVLLIGFAREEGGVGIFHF